MIDRYTRKEMGQLWADENKFQKWLDVELAVLKVLGRRGVVPKNAAGQIASKAKIKVGRILELEKTLRHDVISFTTSIAEQVGPVGRYFHYGLTSSDVVDTAFSLLLTESLGKIIEGVEELEITLEKQARRNQNVPCMGRTHGVHAEPTSFGLKFLGWLCEFRRQRERLVRAQENIRFGKLSGAVGSYGALDPAHEQEALDLLGLQVEPVATQVVPRDRHAEFFSALAELGGSIERVAVELRHLQRTEVHEVEEALGKGQKGSSAMPHKKNPISAENLSGCARLLRSYAVAAFENVALWHERDISHSSVERVIGPDATILADYMVNRLNDLLKGLQVRRGDIDKNLKRLQGIYYSGHVLLRLVEKGVSREEAYAVVQAKAHQAWEKNRWYGDLLWDDALIRKNFSRSELNQILNVKQYLKHIDTIYARVLGGRSGQKEPKKTKK